MAKFVFLLVALVLQLQSALSEVRDQRHVVIRINHIKSMLPVVSKEVQQIDQKNKVEKEAMQGAGLTFIREGGVCTNHLERGIIGNSQPNEHGKELHGYLQTADQFTQWLRSILQKDDPKLQQNLNEAVLSFEMFLPITKTALEKVKESSKNSELSSNSIMNGIDNALALFCNLQGHMENRKKTNSELHNKLRKVLNEVLGNLSELASNSYNVKELAAHSRQLKHLIHEIVERTKTLLKSTTDQGEFKAALGKSVKKLEDMEIEIQNKVNPKLAFPAIQNLYKNWISELSKTVIDLDNHAKGHNNAVRAVLFDALGVVAYFKTDLDIISGKIH